MRWWLLIVVSVLLVACSPKEGSTKLLEKSGFEVTGHVVADAFESPEPCTDDLQCRVGRLCVEGYCQPKPVS